MVRIWSVIVVLAVFAAGLPSFLHKGTGGTSELPVYTMAGERIAGGEEIYRRDDAKPFTYPPFFAVVFVPFPGVPLEEPRPWPPILLWYLINVATLVWIVRIVHRRVACQAGSPVAFWVITALLSARHVSSVFGNQSHDLFVLLPIVLGVDAWCRRRDLAGGAWVGVAAACKATPLLFGLPFLVQWGVLAGVGLVLGVGLASVIPDLIFPRDDGQLWIGAWYHTFVSGVQPGGAADSGPWSADAFLNQSLSGTLHRLLVPPQDASVPFVLDVALLDVGPGVKKAVTAAAAGVVVLLVATVAWLARRGASESLGLRRFGVASAVVCGMVLLSPMSSKSHFCVLLLPSAFCALHWLRRRDAGLGGLLLATFLLGTCTTKGLLGRSFGNELLARGAVTWSALLSLVAVVWVFAVQPRGEEGA